jgi:hypothetical protein
LFSAFRRNQITQSPYIKITNLKKIKSQKKLPTSNF